MARRLGQDWASNGAQDIWDNEVSMLAPSLAGIKYPRIEGDGLQWPCPIASIRARHPAQGREFTCGQGKFIPMDWTPPAEVPDAEYPLVLSTGRRLYHYHTRTQTGRAGIKRIPREETADIRAG